MKCRVCKGQAVIQIRRHNANFCGSHFVEHIHRQVERAIHDFEMIRPGDRMILGVSGGKDSLALWDVMTELGYHVDGVYLHLGIGDYSSDALDLSRRFASDRSLDLRIVDLPAEFGFSVPEAASATRRVPCSACGLSKRYILNKVAADNGYQVLVMGHNLDDEAATLFSNVIGWQTEYLARQRPVLEGRDGLTRKIKPLIRIAERETAAYAVVRGIDYEVEECPMAKGNTINRYKEWLNRLEDESPGIKSQFLLGFVDRGFRSFEPPEPPELGTCGECGSPTTSEVCAFCNVRGRTLVHIESRR